MHTNRAERGKMTIVSEKHEDFSETIIYVSSTEGLKVREHG
jgi:hypothetical protein